MFDLVRVNVNEGKLDAIRCMGCDPKTAEPLDTTDVKAIIFSGLDEEDVSASLKQRQASSSSSNTEQETESNAKRSSAGTQQHALDDASRIDGGGAASSKFEGSTSVPSLVLLSLAEKCDLFERFELMTLSKALDSMSDIKYCPRCSQNPNAAQRLNVPVVVEDGNYCCCPHCRLQFCAVCLDVYHPGSETCTNEPGLSQTAIREQNKRTLQEQQSLNLIRKTSKKCPHCSFAIQKTAGCNKMRCENCTTKFCWVCLEVIDDYEHFRNNEKCVLFDEEAIRDWEREVQAAGAVHRIDGGDPHGQEAEQVRCRLCGHQNVRWRALGGDLGNGDGVPRDPGDEGGERAPRVRVYRRNNHLRCQVCAQHSCLVCRRRINERPITAHFRPRGACEQFSMIEHVVG
ncbi:unnamed protein product [Amoebophrya sp. A25]|nr:unnamed protein product [Amoebophrya sp. A25]|eukprot:GSA25T00009856001.1